MSACVLMVCLWSSASAGAAETDQYLAWGVELDDSTDAFNRYLNAEIERFLDKMNRRTRPCRKPQKLVCELYGHMFQGLHSSRVRKWLNNSEAVDRFPDKSVSFLKYQRMSIYRGLAFPYILPMARTIRLNDVHLGIDKIAHMFGFGRRYYQRYCRQIDKGVPKDEAVEGVIRWGISQETTFVGKLVDGIMSYADLEADYQGFRLARNLCAEKNPHIVRENGTWRLVRRVDIREYITPEFDESYNTSDYWGRRKKQVLAVMKEEYAHKHDLPCVKMRFQRYRQSSPSLSTRLIAEYYREKGKKPQRKGPLYTLYSACSD